jgi:hypothetical protein
MWLTSQRSAAVQEIVWLQRIDVLLAEEALVVLRRHVLYLTPEVVLFRLFSKKLSMEEKSRIACRLLTHKTDIPETYKLNSPWLMRRQSQWTSSLPTPSSSTISFGVAKDFVKTVKLTNDVAERAVKMSKDMQLFWQRMMESEQSFSKEWKVQTEVPKLHEETLEWADLTPNL